MANALKTLDGAGSIQQAAKAYRTTHDARQSSKPLGESVKLFLKSRENLRDSTQKSYSYMIRNHVVGQKQMSKGRWFHMWKPSPNMETHTWVLRITTIHLLQATCVFSWFQSME